MTKYLYNTLWALGNTRFRRDEFFQQLYFIGNRSLPIVVFCVAFAAIVTILESSFHMRMVIQNDSMVPGFAAILILRELGVIIASLLLCSRVGAGYASEVATMQITEQIDALKMLNINPYSYLVVPRVLAGVVGTVFISIVANMVCLYAAAKVAEIYMGFTPNMFLNSMLQFVEMKDLFFAAVKGAVFGGIIPLVACYMGFNCKNGADGVGSATTNAVVVASVLIIVFDFIMSYVFSYFY